MQGSLTLTFAPEVARDRLVFRLWPNSPVQARAGAKLNVAGIRVNDAAVTPTRPDPTTLVVHRTVAAGDPTIVYISAPSAFLIPHETAHQWFYSLVGDDQARDPWLDETLAQWASARYGNTVAQETNTQIPAAVQNQLGQPMSFWARFPFMPDTYAGLYEQGVKALHALGDDDAVDCALRRYAHDNAYRVAVPPDLLHALTPDFPGAENVLRVFGARF